jgi:hypothetical protein
MVTPGMSPGTPSSPPLKGSPFWLNALCCWLLLTVYVLSSYIIYDPCNLDKQHLAMWIAFSDFVGNVTLLQLAFVSKGHLNMVLHCGYKLTLSTISDLIMDIFLIPTCEALIFIIMHPFLSKFNVVNSWKFIHSCINRHFKTASCVSPCMKACE